MYIFVREFHIQPGDTFTVYNGAKSDGVNVDKIVTLVGSAGLLLSDCGKSLRMFDLCWLWDANRDRGVFINQCIVDYKVKCACN